MPGLGTSSIQMPGSARLFTSALTRHTMALGARDRFLEMLTVDDVRRAREVVSKYLDRTPLQAAPPLSEELGCDVYLKLELVQPCRVYKVRGALAKLDSLDPERRRRGVVAASAGSHAQAVSWAGWRLDVPATVVMPRSASPAIVRICRSYGARVLLDGEVYDDAAVVAHEIEAGEGRTYVHPFADPVVVAGQGTIGLEILEQLPDAEAILAGMGGGGLVAGIATAVKGAGWRGKIYGIEPEGADAISRSLEAGRIVAVDHPHSIADKLVARTTDPFTFDLLRRHLDGTARVGESEIADAVFRYLDLLSLLVEPSGAVGLAALRAGKLDLRGKKVVLVVSGGNVPAVLLARILGERLVARA